MKTKLILLACLFVSPLLVNGEVVSAGERVVIWFRSKPATAQVEVREYSVECATQEPVAECDVRRYSSVRLFFAEVFGTCAGESDDDDDDDDDD